ncbi:MAG: hypothetical protein ONB46_10645 [candidate division KSB1 bacterium]|nr:hypothetical protein [candidate division KSB1 bacterium]MDZ7366263.1 hypothetical protein [candidate division KSB1 bacterium]MDZ7404481.1 hypothetical protein [candidate division KSB1 bacterium]
MGLFKRFHAFVPKLLQRMKCNRVIPPVVVQLGELKGVIYSSDRWSPGRKRNFIHFMANPPKLVSNPQGTQLYIVGGRYRITPKGIEG